jgi:hypothetical protein
MFPDVSSSPLGLAGWLREGLRASVLRAPRIDVNVSPRPQVLLAVLCLLVLLEIGLSRFEVAGPAVFDVRGWLAPWWTTAVITLVAWAALAPAGRPVAAWFTLWTAGMLPAVLVSLLLGIAQAQDLLPDMLYAGSLEAWLLYLALWVWTGAIAVRLASHYGASRRGLASLAAGLVGVLAIATLHFPDRPWQPEGASAAADPGPRLVLSQQVLEAQQDAWRQGLERLAPERPGVVDVYGLVFAPYAEEDVFLRESTMVARLLEESFDAQGRVLQLVNHPATAETHAWATPENLRRAVESLAQRMDPLNDLLVVYLTSHGANDFRLAASNPPLAVEPVSPGELRQALDNAGIRHRVIAVSACYSGGWVGPLAGDTALVMTAADATHTSYGCGRLSELTFFGRAVFDEQLRKTRSFEKAFAAALPVIRQREQAAGKNDGFSNPQIAVGDKIRPLLAELEKRLNP